jgi:hypothetical protein
MPAAQRALDALAPTRWLPPNAAALVAPLTCWYAEQAELELEESGDAARVVLPVSPARVGAWLHAGDVKRRAVALVDARGGCDPGTLRARVLRCEHSSDDRFKALWAATAEAHRHARVFLQPLQQHQPGARARLPALASGA